MKNVMCPHCKDLHNMKYRLMEVAPRYYFACYCGNSETDMNRDFYGNIIHDKLHDYTLWLKVNNGRSESLALAAEIGSYVIAWGSIFYSFKTEKIIQPAEALETLQKYLKLKAFT